MCNSIFLGKKTIPEAEDGEDVEIMVKGVYHTDEDGVRKLDIISVDGEEVEDPSACGCDEEHEDPMDMNGEEALNVFLIKKRKK